MTERRLWILLSMGVFVCCLLAATTIFANPDCFDCEVPWGWPLPYKITEGFAAPPILLPIGLVVDLVTATAISLAAGGALVRLKRLWS
jgi:hypothetical protein